MGRVKIDIESEHFFARIDNGVGQMNIKHENANKFIVYGTDLMRTRRLTDMFFKYEPDISWIDSSHCLFVF